MKKLHLFSALLFFISVFIVNLSTICSECTGHEQTKWVNLYAEQQDTLSSKQLKGRVVEEKPFRAGRALRIGATGLLTLFTLSGAGICFWDGSRGAIDAVTGNTEKRSDGMMYGNNSGGPIRMVPGLFGVGAFTGFLSYKLARSFWNQVKGFNRPYTPEDKKKDIATFAIAGAGITGLAGWKFWPKKA